jgi:MoaE-MoaD fusion protein
MRVRVLFFGMIRDVAGRTADTLELREGATVSEVLKQFCTSMNRFSDYEKSVALAVNREYVSTDTVLKDGDELAVLPPVSGGSGEEAPEKAQFGAEIVHDRIDSKRIVNALSHRDVGAILVFEGVVRGNTRGRRTLYLDYEAYEPMALKELKRLQAQAKEKFAITEAAIVHRLGRLQVGETSVLIVVSSAHRAAGFDACRWIIDTLKKTVPIWKKEYFEDGAVWADGDPFPEELRPRPVNPVDEGA